MTPKIDLWFSCGSTYTYLTMMRLDAVEAAEGVHFNLRPFQLRVLFKEMGRAPFLQEPQKSAYMWRDIERRAAAQGLSPTLPAPYPAPEVALANEVAYLGLRQGWGRPYLQASYRTWFEQGAMPGEPENLGPSLAAVGQDEATVLAELAKGEISNAMERDIDEARDLGLFGSPFSVVGRELFWGDDRLEEAARWAHAKSPR